MFVSMKKGFMGTKGCYDTLTMRISHQKMEIGYCQEYLENCEACTDPCTHCKFRPQCVIWEMCRKSEKRYRLEKAAKGQAY